MARRSRRALAMVLMLAQAGCAGGGSVSGRYVGAAPACGRIEGGGSTATLTRQGATFALVPYDGSLVIEGRVAADGTLSGALALRPAQAPGAEGTAAKPPPRAPQQATAQGRIAGDTAAVDYAAPGCSASLTLRQVHPPLF